ncbi:MAG TPA: cupredoxin family copper-binding protein [Steroidobacteraceae bacterium]|jgi:plastocyanin
MTVLVRADRPESDLSNDLHLRRHRPAQMSKQTPTRIFPAMLAIPLLVGGVACSEPAASSASQAPHTFTVTIENMRFDPQALTVKRGDRVVWINKDMFPHTATSAANAFDSGSIAADTSWTYVAGTPGDYAYVCAFHPTMQGRLTVQ